MREETLNSKSTAYRKAAPNGHVAQEHRVVLDDLDDPIVPATPATNIVGGALLIVVVLAMVPGAVDTGSSKN